MAWLEHQVFGLDRFKAKLSFFLPCHRELFLVVRSSWVEAKISACVVCRELKKSYFWN